MRLLIIVICVSIFFGQTTNGSDPDENLRYLQRDLAKHLKVENYKEMEMSKFKKVLSDLHLQEASTNRFLQGGSLCTICRFLVKQLQERTLTVRRIAEVLCNIYITFSTWTLNSFCADIINLNMPILEYIINKSEILTPNLACSILLQMDTCYSSEPALSWRINITSLGSKKIPQVNRTDDKPLKILHITDLHLTPDYEIGGVSDCGYPVCCKQDLGNPKRAKAGKWGDYNCDVPLWTFAETLKHINETHKDLDMIYFTGDTVDHTIWKASVEENSNLLYYTYKSLYESFDNITVLPVLGNHDSVPLNIYPPPNKEIEDAGFSVNWLYTLHSKIWRPWLSQEALENVAKQGYYSHTVNKKFKVIVLNNNVGYNFNWWLLYDTTFLTEQLNFLRKELEKSEQNEQFVHILGHVSPGNKESIEPFETNYMELIRRFSHIIKGQFFGHTHTDEWKLFYDENGKAINMGYNGASVTPYVKYNPNYKIVTVDPNNFEVLDVDSYIFNLNDANAESNGRPNWYKLYSMKEDYGLNSLSPENFDQLAMNMFTNDTLFNLYWRYYVRDGKSSISEGCNNDCKKKLICAIVTTESLSPSKKECWNV